MNNTMGMIENNNALKYNYCLFNVFLKSIILLTQGLVGLSLSHKTCLWTQKLKF